MIADHPVQFLFYFVALVLLFLAGIGVSVPRVQLGWLGMASWLVAAVFVPFFGG